MNVGDIVKVPRGRDYKIGVVHGISPDRSRILVVWPCQRIRDGCATLVPGLFDDLVEWRRDTFQSDAAEILEEV